MRKGANGMNKKDKELLEQLKGELNKAASEVKVPERLQKTISLQCSMRAKRAKAKRIFPLKRGIKTITLSCSGV